LRKESVRLPDGREMLLRPIDAADAEPIAVGFSLLNEEEVRRRFLHPIKALSAEHLFRLTHPRARREFAVVAAEPLPPGEALVGAVARLACDDHDPARAEFAILVSRFLAGQGLGTRLMRRLVEWCQANGIRELYGEVMDDNTAMLALAASLGFRRESHLGAPGIVTVSLRLD
jgi:RimJ/RimL family protein N-acetyltransferase